MKKVYPPYELSLITSRCHVAGLPTDVGTKGRLASTPWIFSFTSFSAPRLALSTIILSQLLAAAVTSFVLVMVSVFSLSLSRNASVLSAHCVSSATLQVARRSGLRKLLQ